MVASPDGSERPRGILSPADRKYLLASDEELRDEYSRQARSKRDEAIHVRVRNALKDFQILVSELSQADFEKIFQQPSAGDINGMTAALSFIYRGTRNGVQVGGFGFGSAKASFEPMLRRAIRNSEATLDGPDTNPLLFDVIFDHDTIITKKTVPADSDIERISAKIDADEINDLSRGELAWFIQIYNQSGELDTDAAVDAYQRMESLLDSDPEDVDADQE